MDERELIPRLLQGDAAAFRYAVSAFQPAMRAVARAITNDAIADEVVQDAWIAILRALPKFEGRSSLRTWLIQIVANHAKTRRRREIRNIAVGQAEDVEAALSAQRFVTDGHWAQPPAQWGVDTPEQILASEQLQTVIAQAIESLSDTQKSVISLHDLEGMEVAEICNILEIGESNCRVQLHRARLKVWAAIDRFHQGGDTNAGNSHA